MINIITTLLWVWFIVALVLIIGICLYATVLLYGKILNIIFSLSGLSREYIDCTKYKYYLKYRKRFWERGNV